MSTFKGVIDEFPDIRIDYFRPSKDPTARAPLACFLTHIHSDHIQGLDGFYGGPFIHCSAATKELLLRLERRTHRWNLAKGVLESRRCQYAEKKSKLKVIPLETPTVVELDTKRSVRVTLFDANHCPGAVMFLIEGDGKAVLYTGDIRAEPWWVDYLSRHPILIPYTAGIKRLDKIYLDTTFAARKKTDQLFSPKREGIRELIEKVGRYPQDTIFHFNTWTFGYEDVWVALAAAFGVKIHVSDYHFRLFHYIRNPDTYVSGPYLKGYKFGNAEVPGCLTKNPAARFHSCERKVGCPGLHGKANIVWITPIITRLGSFEVHEAGLGDLENNDDLVLHGDHLQLLLDGLGDVDPRVRALLEDARNTRKQALALDVLGEEDVGVEELVGMLGRVAVDTQGDDDYPPRKDAVKDATIVADDGELLPNKITFPYSRHSSHSELRGLVAVFRPRDIHPCVVEDKSWDESKTMEYLFGDLCEGGEFAHDREMRARVEEERRRLEAEEEEREGLEVMSQIMMDRTQADLPLFDMEGLQERTAGRKNPVSSTASYSPVSSRPTTPRLRKRPIEGDNTPKARELNSSVVNQVIELTSSPPLPPMLKLGSNLHSSNLTPLEAARLAGSSTASSSPQVSPVRPRPTRPTSEAVPRASKRVKREEYPSSSQQEFFDASDRAGVASRATSCSNTLGRETELLQKQPPLAVSDSGVDEMDQEEVLEAMEAALGVNGKSWWDVELSCTVKKWRYVEEIEL